MGRTPVDYWGAFKGQALLLGYIVLVEFWAENAAGFFAGFVFLGFGVSFLFLGLPLLLLLLLSGGRPGCFFFLFCPRVLQDSAGLPLRGQAGATCMLSCLFFSLSPGRSPPPLSPSVLSLSLSLSLFAACTQSTSYACLVD